MRLVIELTRNVDPKDVLADLFKQTPLQQTFGMQMLALVDGEPRTLSLKRTLHLFIQHRQEIIRRRSEFDLKRARERAHILEGLLRALDILDQVIDTIRRSQSAETARTNLVRAFGFSEIQAQAILDMQLRRLAALERRKLQDEYKELQKQIAYLEDLLAHPAKILAVIKTDLLAIKEQYADPRRTQIVDRTKGTLTTTDLLPDQEVWVTVGANGEVRRQDATRLSATTLRQIGKESGVEVLTANTRDFLYLFAREGRCRRVAVHELPQAGDAKHLAELTEYTRRDEVTAALALPRGEAGTAQGYLFLVTEQGMVKRVTLADFMAASATDPQVINVDEEDRLRWVLQTSGDQEIILVTAAGVAIRFREEDVRSMGLAAGGVGGIKLKRGDQLIYAALVDSQGELLTMTAQGYAKRTPLEQYPTQGRNGGGVVTHKPTPRTGPVSGALLLPAETPEAIIVLPRKGAVQVMATAEIPSMGRGVQGKQVVQLGDGNAVAALKLVRDAAQVRMESATPVVTLPAASPVSTNGKSSDAHPAAGNGSTADGRGRMGSAGKGKAAPDQPADRAKDGKPALRSREAIQPRPARHAAPGKVQQVALMEPAPEKPGAEKSSPRRENASDGDGAAVTRPQRRTQARQTIQPAEDAPGRAKRRGAADAETAQAPIKTKRETKPEAASKPARKKAEVGEAAEAKPASAGAKTRGGNAGQQGKTQAKGAKPPKQTSESGAKADVKAEAKNGAKNGKTPTQPSLLPPEPPAKKTPAKLAAVTSVKRPRR
ncbi:MAG: hypothetical protein DCC57_18975 [Chloroflexi bacterium]|nr:MAG: hypothetical protein DCC57_18975 [Chloroflexota bacterium]